MTSDLQIDSMAILRDRMSKTISVLKRDFATLRAGRANPQILDRVMVDYYGTPTPIAQMANISSPEPRLLVISLWDTGMLKQVEKAILSSNIGINPTNDGKVIRLVFPELTEERRRELVKVARKMAEESKVAVRAIRRVTNDQFAKQKKDNLLTEDDLKLMEKEVQKTTDDFIKEIDQAFDEKEKEILSI